MDQRCSETSAAKPELCTGEACSHALILADLFVIQLLGINLIDVRFAPAAEGARGGVGEVADISSQTNPVPTVTARPKDKV